MVALAVAVILALAALEDPGYVLISRAPHEIEISLALFLLLLVMVILLVYFGVRFLVRLFQVPRDISRWKGHRNQVLAQQATLDGYARLIEGDWEEAEKILTRRLRYSATPLLDCLGAAYAAQQRDDANARDGYLAHARALDPEHIEAIELTRARLLERSGQTDEARGVLEHLHEQGTDSRAAQAMLVSLLRLQRDWQALEAILPQLSRSALLPATELETAWRDVQCQRLSNDIDSDDGTADRVWSGLSRRDRRDPVLVGAYCRQLIDTGNMTQAESLLRKTLKRQWQGSLVRLYGLLRTKQPADQIRITEGWAKVRREDPDLLTAMARLNLHAGNRDQARSLLLESARHGGGRETYMELGLLLEAAGEGDKALQCYRQGLERIGRAPQPRPTSAGELLPLMGSKTESG